MPQITTKNKTSKLNPIQKVATQRAKDKRKRKIPKITRNERTREKRGSNDRDYLDRSRSWIAGVESVLK